jgi:Domain of unknown function (DUF3291)
LIKEGHVPLISITRLRVRSWLYFPSFFVQANRSAKQAAAAPGSLAVRLLADRRRAFWTMTAWSSEAAMKAFMHAGTHGAVMRKLMDWCDEAAMVHWTQESASLPAWDEAHRRMQEGAALEGTSSIGCPYGLPYSSACRREPARPAPEVGASERRTRRCHVRLALQFGRPD